MSDNTNRRILLIDDNPAIHEDFKKILTPALVHDAGFSDMRSAFLGAGEEPGPKVTVESFELILASQGQEGFDLVCEACAENKPFAMAFVDMRMPPGWDGVETIAKLWERDPNLQVVICTAYSDYTWEETIQILGKSDRLLILKKPFDAIEITMLASAFVSKWNMGAREKEYLENIVRAEQEARAYAASLETVNRALVTSKASADMAIDLRTEFLVQVSNEMQVRLSEVLGMVVDYSEGALDGPPAELEIALDVSRRLLGTLDEVMDVTSLEQGKQFVGCALCSPVAIAQEVATELREQATNKGFELEVLIEAGVPDEFRSEPKGLQQILRSLTQNAINHTEKGGVCIALKCGVAEGWQRPQVIFEVRDTGAGIEHERLGNIFEPFERSQAGGAGYGFGLALARRMATLLGGEITVRSEVGSGTCFSFELGYDHVESSTH
ncbi:MAG: signal transduction histidine kinase [Candidatus Paceibacteria bacterium]|jgi:signal transduction histidine kinase